MRVDLLYRPKKLCLNEGIYSYTMYCSMVSASSDGSDWAGLLASTTPSGPATEIYMSHQYLTIVACREWMLIECTCSDSGRYFISPLGCTYTEMGGCI